MNADRAVHPTRGHSTPPPKTGAAAWRAPRTALLLVVLTALAVALAVVASPAQADPQQPTMTLTRLEALLAASPTGTVPGYFLTTDKGTDIATIDCTVEGVVPEAADDGGSEIMFDASGNAIIDSIDGIAEGMSGSPLYVEEPNTSTEELVGAVAYGSEFTDSGLGLATPIEHMMTLESEVSAGPLTAAPAVALKRPLSVAGKTISSVVVAPTETAARALKVGSHTVVMRPLSTLTVTGLPAASPLYKTVSKMLAAKGIQITDGLDDQGSAGTEPNFTTPLVPGSAVGEFFGWGDYSYGAMGTTTYTTDDNTLVAFGHPVVWDGQISAFLTNCDTIGLWSNLDDPFKELAPGMIRGAVTVDSGPGIAGTVADQAIPTEVPLISTATNEATGQTVSQTTYVTPYAIDQIKDPFPELNASAFYPAMFQAMGDEYYDGHLSYELTIDVTDGTHSYQIVRDNQWEDTTGWDAASFAVSDIYNIIEQLITDPDGTINAHITGITLVSQLSPQHLRARIADATVDRGLKIGKNTIHVSLYPYGSTTPVNQDVTLTIPKGTALDGSLYVIAPDLNLENFEGSVMFVEDEPSSPTGPPETLGDVVKQIESQYANNDLLVAYDPQSGYGDVSGSSGQSNYPWSTEATAPVATDMHEFLSGGVVKSTASLSLQAMPPHITAGEPVMVAGQLQNSDATSGTVSLYERLAGATADTLVTTVPLQAQGGSSNDEGPSSLTFQGLVPPLEHNATITAVWSGDSQYLAASASAAVAVSPHISFKVTKKAGGVLLLKAATSPKCSGVIAFAAVPRHGGPSLIKAVGLSDGRASYRWKAPAGDYRLEALFRGNALNATGASRTVTMTVPSSR